MRPNQIAFDVKVFCCLFSRLSGSAVLIEELTHHLRRKARRMLVLIPSPLLAIYAFFGALTTVQLPLYLLLLLLHRHFDCILNLSDILLFHLIEFELSLERCSPINIVLAMSRTVPAFHFVEDAVQFVFDFHVEVLG